MQYNIPIQNWTKNQTLQKWIQDIATLCQPTDIWLCDGSQREYDELFRRMVAHKTATKLNESKRPNSFLCRSTPDDVARVENRTFICSEKEIDAGPTNNWKDPREMKKILLGLFKGCMQGRTLYVIPYSMGDTGSPISHIGIQITDSPYAVCNMHIMTRMGTKIVSALGNGHFVPGIHSVAMPLKQGQEDVPWPCNPENKYIVHFPETREIWSFGSGYGGNALLGKKCFALRIASCLARDEGWLAEHMLILSLTNPQGEKKYFAAAFPSACGKTNLAMLRSTLPGWEVKTVGDDIAWMRFDDDGRLYAINPEFGFFGVAPGTSFQTNPSAMETIRKNTIFTNVGLTDECDVWWEGMSKTPPKHLINWLDHSWTPTETEKAAHPNARFTAPIDQCPVLDEAWNDPKGVPISAILFGGRRSSAVPLIYETFDWQHGTFIGASVSSETTAAAAGEVGKLRHDPFAMLPFCGYNMGDYFGHWLKMGERKKSKHLPRIYYVNWFRKNAQGEFLWPGFGENVRVLKWIFERCSGIEHAKKTAIGYVPEKQALDLSGMSLRPQAIEELFHIDKEGWLKDIESLSNFFAMFGNRLPDGIKTELQDLKTRLNK